MDESEATESVRPFDPHFRVAIKQTAKGAYQVEATASLPAPVWPEQDGKTAAAYAVAAVKEAREGIKADLQGRMADEEPPKA